MGGTFISTRHQRELFHQWNRQTFVVQLTQSVGPVLIAQIMKMRPLKRSYLYLSVEYKDYMTTGQESVESHSVVLYIQIGEESVESHYVVIYIQIANCSLVIYLTLIVQELMFPVKYVLSSSLHHPWTSLWVTIPPSLKPQAWPLDHDR